MGLSDAMKAVVTVAAEHPGIVRGYQTIPGQVSEWPSLVAAPGPSQLVENALEGYDWLLIHTVKLWLNVAPLNTNSINRLQDAADLATPLMVRINRAFLDDHDAFAPYQAVTAVEFNPEFAPEYGAVAHIGGQFLVIVKEHTLYGPD